MQRCAELTKEGHRHNCGPPLLTLLVMALQARREGAKHLSAPELPSVLFQEGGFLDVLQVRLLDPPPSTPPKCALHNGDAPMEPSSQFS